MSKIHSEEEYESKVDALTTLRLFAPVVSSVLPFPSSTTHSDEYDDVRRTSNLHLPFTSPYKMPSFAKPSVQLPVVNDDVEDVVQDALDSLAIESLSSELPEEPSQLRRPTLSYRERSVRLVRHCSSWTLLGDAEGRLSFYDSQSKMPLLCLDPMPLY